MCSCSVVHEDHDPLGLISCDEEEDGSHVRRMDAPYYHVTATDPAAPREEALVLQLCALLVL